MAANLVKAGHKVTGFRSRRLFVRRREGRGCRDRGVRPGRVEGAEIVVTMLPAGKHVVSVWSEIVPGIQSGAVIVDCSTVDVESARRAHAIAAEFNLRSLDAPVSGGTVGAKAATLTFMVGGSEHAFAAGSPCWPRWVAGSSIAAMRGPGRLPRSATT
jgi:3-hydroxyisobutyrate dehydrogenase